MNNYLNKNLFLSPNKWKALLVCSTDMSLALKDTILLVFHLNQFYSIDKKKNINRHQERDMTRGNR